MSIMVKTKKKEKWYRLDKALSKKPDVLLVWGQRSNGKTYACLEYALKKWRDDHKKFVYVRRWHDDIKTANAQQLMDPLPIEEIFGDEYSLTYYRNQYTLHYPDGTKEVIGYITSLSDAYHKKSVPFTDVKTIIFDEFIQQSGESVLPGEMARWESIQSTIIRKNTDVLVIMAANSVSKFSPYFTHYGINVNDMKQGDIREVKIPRPQGYLKVVAEYAEFNQDVGEETAKYILGSKMTVTGEWEIPPVDEIPKTENELIKEKMLFSCYDPESEVMIGVFLHTGIYTTLEKNEQMIYYEKPHMREFLVIRIADKRSKYYHLTNEKSLDYRTFNDFKMMLDEIKENTEIDFINELYRGRVFSENMFVADYFDHMWKTYFKVLPRQLL